MEELRISVEQMQKLSLEAQEKLSEWMKKKIRTASHSDLYGEYYLPHEVDNDDFVNGTFLGYLDDDISYLDENYEEDAGSLEVYPYHILPLMTIDMIMSYLDEKYPNHGAYGVFYTRQQTLDTLWFVMAAELEGQWPIKEEEKV